MKLLSKDLKKGEIKLKVENADDLWYLSHMVDAGDSVKGQTMRKVKMGDKEDRKTSVSKKKVFLKLKVEKVEFHEYTDSLRVSGIVEEGPEDVPHGSHHTFNVEENSIITIIKEHWLKYQLEKLDEAVNTEAPKILVCTLDRENVCYALLKKYGYDILSEMEGDVQKKADDTKVKSNFYEEISNQLVEYDKRHGLNKIIIASPAFWKEELMKHLSPEIKKKAILATCNTTGKNAVNEVLKRPEVKEALKQDRIAKEMNLVEELLQEIKKDNLAVYGFKHVKQAVTAGAVRVLLVTDSLIHKKRQEETYEELDSLLKTADKVKADIVIVSSEHDGGHKLDGLGGIAGILRYKANF